MKLIKITCPNCDSPLEMEEGQKKFKCQYCNTNIVLDDDTIRIDHVVRSGDKEDRIKNAEAALKCEEYIKAYSLFFELSEDYSYEPEIWYNLLKSRTENFGLLDVFIYDIVVNAKSECDNITSQYDELKDELDNVFKHYSKLETDKDRLKKRKKEYNDYLNKLAEYRDRAINHVTSEYERYKKETAEASGIVFKVILIIVAIFFCVYLVSAIICETIERKELARENARQKEIDSIKCNVYCTNSPDSTEPLNEFHSNETFYCCYEFTDGAKDYDYTFYYKDYIDGVSGDFVKLGNYKTGSRECLYSLKDINRTGTYRLEILHNKDKVLCSYDFDVVE